MISHAMSNRFWRALSLAVCCAAFALAGCGGDDDDNSVANNGSTSGPAGFAATKATCGPGDRPETDLQGQVSAATRAAGFQGYSCNLQLIGQSRGDGGSWQHAFFADQAGHKCNYYDTASFTANRSHLGVVAIDATNAASPTPTAYLET